jgi:prepilin-type N-terminal cleavage/methylation domain-containing protein/prepilin-type processing-associated H-X9-DG protein
MIRTEKAFTLVELLVVISIIALLLAVLMPALSKVKEQGRTIICGTNLKNYGLAVGMYANSNGDKFPDQYFLYTDATLNATMKGNKSGFIPRRCRWHYTEASPDGSLWPYLKDKNVHMCPTFRNFAKSGGPGMCNNAGSHGPSLIQLYNPMFSYSMNACLAGWRTPSMRIVEVRRPSQCFVFSEENIGWTIDKGERIKESRTDAYSTSVLNDNLLVVDRTVCDNIGTYHKVSTAKRNDGYGNCVFVDGHVGTVWGRSGSAAYYEYAMPYDGFKW